MTTNKIEQLGRQLRSKRGERGIRATAKDIGVSAATLSRVERGHLPDLDTFGKICRWLEVDPSEMLGLSAQASPHWKVAVHFKKDQTLKPETAQALAQLILTAHRFQSSG